MQHNLQHTISLLARTPATLDALLRDLPEEWTMRNEGGNTFNAFDAFDTRMIINPFFDSAGVAL